MHTLPTLETDCRTCRHRATPIGRKPCAHCRITLEGRTLWDADREVVDAILREWEERCLRGVGGAPAR